MFSADGKHQPALQVASIIGSAFRNFLGPSKSVKFFVEQDDLESVSITSTRQLLQLLDLQHPIGEMIASAVQTHDSVYGCYSTTIVVLLGHWCQEFRSIIAMGYPVRPMLNVGDELLASCISAVLKSSISLDQLRAHQQVHLWSGTSQSASRYSKTGVIESVLNINETPEFKDIGLVGAYTCKNKAEMVRGMNLETVDNHRNENYTDDFAGKQETRTTVCSSTGRPHHPEEVESIVPAESGKWSTYQEIMEDQDVSWFFTDDHNEEEETDLQILSELTDDQRTTQCDFREQRNPEMRNVGGMSTSYDMCRYNLGKPSDETSDAVSSSLFHSQTSNHLTDLKRLHDEFHQLELERNCTYQWNREAEVNDRQEDSDDEFAGCFDNLPNFSQDENVSDIQLQVNHSTGYKKANDVGDAKKHSPVSFDQTDTKISATKCQHNSLDDIDALIKKKLKESSKLSLLKGTSQSRHFRTVTDSKIESIEINEDDVLEPSHESLSYKINESLDVDTSLCNQRKENRGIKMDSVLLRNRHFQEQDQTSSKSSVVDQDQVQSDLSMSRGVDRMKSVNGMKDNGKDQTNLKSVSERVREDVTVAAVSDQESIMDMVDLLGPALSYGSDQAMKIAMQMFKSKTRSELNPMNTKWLLHICRVLGPSSSESRVEAGLILPISSHQVPLFSLLNKSQPRLLLVLGDIEPTYHHLGYKESLKPDVVIENTSQTSQKDWKQKVIDHLRKLHINIVVAKGTVDGSLCTDCLAENVLIVQRAKFSALKSLAAGSEANILTYILDAEEADVGTVSSLNTLEGGRTKGQRLSLSNQDHLLGIQTESSLHTAVLCASSQHLLDGVEDNFTSCIHRLTQAIADDKVLPGAGYAETVAINNLNGITENPDLVDRQDVARALRSGWESYLLQLAYNCKEINDWSEGMGHVARAVRMNASPCGCDIHSVVDCASAKIAAWKTAWRLLGIILLTDAHIATGLDDAVL